MFRSLFIGFLILSALTANGAETRVAENKSKMPADMLPGFFGSVPGQAEKAASGIVSAGTGKAFFSCCNIDCKASGLLPGISGGDAAFAFFEDSFWLYYWSGLAKALPEQVFPPADGSFYCVSGLSPPYFAYSA